MLLPKISRSVLRQQQTCGCWRDFNFAIDGLRIGVHCVAPRLLARDRSSSWPSPQRSGGEPASRWGSGRTVR